VHGHEDHALAVRWACLQVLQAFDMGQARQARRPPPAHGHFKEGDAGGGEVFLEQALALAADFSGKHSSRLRAAMRRRSPATRYIRAQQATDGQQRRIRQLHDQPQQAQAQPQRPETRMKK
jgi:hypothetical protein